MDKSVKIVEQLHTQFPELDQLEEAGAVGTFIKGAAQNLGQQMKTAAVNTAKKIVPQGIQKAVQAGQQAVKQQPAQQNAQQPTASSQKVDPAALTQQFQQIGRKADLEQQFQQIGQAGSVGASDLMTDLTDSTEIFTSALQALQAFANQSEPGQPTQQVAEGDRAGSPTEDTQEDPKDAPTAPGTAAESVFRHPEYLKLQALYEADAPAAPEQAQDQTAEFKQAVTKFLGKYSDPAALAKNQKGQQILQKLVQVASNLGITIPNMPSADQIKNAIAEGPAAINNLEDLKKALDVNPQAAEAFVQALVRAPKNGPIGQAFNNLLQKPAQ